MKILHYTLGFPPYRSGGLTKYAVDIAKEQISQGHAVSIIWPGRINPLFRQNFSFQGKVYGIDSIELINPLPLPLMNGIRNIDLYMQKRDISVFRKFIREQKPDVIHIHTLMGLPKEFLLAAKEVNIKLVYTTHDYFGLCPKVSFFCKDNVCTNKESCEACYLCNEGAFSYPMIIAMQSATYRKLKGKKVTKYLRNKKKEKDNIQKQTNELIDTNVFPLKDNYIQLRNFYISLFAMIDVFHFNSKLSKQIYESFFQPKQGVVIPILHANIKDHRSVKNFGKTLKISYMAEAKAYKGFSVLLDSLDVLVEKSKKDFILKVFSSSNIKKGYMIEEDHYDISELQDIFDKTDLVVVPSMCIETFGFVVLEALSFGVPVIVTDRVGAKDLVGEMGFVIDPTKESLTNVIEKLYDDRNLLVKCNDSIVCATNLDFNFVHHVKSIVELYHE